MFTVSGHFLAFSGAFGHSSGKPALMVSLFCTRVGGGQHAIVYDWAGPAGRLCLPMAMHGGREADSGKSKKKVLVNLRFYGPKTGYWPMHVCV